MSVTLDAILDNASGGIATTVELSAESSAVLLYAIYLLESRQNWLDRTQDPLDEITISDWDAIEKIVANASYEIMTEVAAVTPVGATMIWHTNTPPDRWLLLDGSGWLETDYPELFALWGHKYGGGGGFFAVPNMGSRSPYGVSATVPLDSYYGAETHTLTMPEMPAHTHPPLSPMTSFVGNVAAGTNGLTTASTNRGTAATTGSAGGGGSHNNMHPVFGVWYIVYAGK